MPLICLGVFGTAAALAAFVVTDLPWHVSEGIEMFMGNIYGHVRINTGAAPALSSPPFSPASFARDKGGVS